MLSKYTALSSRFACTAPGTRVVVSTSKGKCASNQVVDTDKVSAECDQHGVLLVTIPKIPKKPASSESKDIPIALREK